MNKISGLLIFLSVISSDLLAQVLPKEGSSLNYRLIGLSVPTTQKTNNCKFEIALGNYNTEESFKKHIVKTLVSKSSKVIAEVPAFGKEYTWRAVYSETNISNPQSEFHHFSTSTIPEVDSLNVRFRVMDKAKKYKDALVLLDGNKIMYDMAGKPMWFLPNNIPDIGPGVFDLKATQFGTITFLATDKGYEITLAGKVLWKTPEENNVGRGQMQPRFCQRYHHDFTRLANGHYMALGNELMYYKAPQEPNSNERIVFYKESDLQLNEMDYQAQPFGTILEFDKEGKLVWSWRSFEYYQQSDVINYKPRNGIPVVDLHENSFFFDEKEKAVYLSFKNISRIVKIKYPEGTVLNNYGETYTPGKAIDASGNGLFCNQHACRRSAIGCLFLYNNNGCDPTGLPKIKRFEEPANNRYDKLKKTWEFTCSVEPACEQRKFLTGGNVVELPDGSMFVCMGGTYSKVFIVHPDKKILWSALPEKWNANTNKWQPIAQYRASVICDRKTLESLVWKSEMQ